MNSIVKRSLFREKLKPSSKYEVKVRSLHKNTKPERLLLKYEVIESIIKI
jgi:hypothetical protein